jgi:hypothetical protein
MRSVVIVLLDPTSDADSHRDPRRRITACAEVRFVEVGRQFVPLALAVDLLADSLMVLQIGES